MTLLFLDTETTGLGRYPTTKAVRSANLMNLAAGLPRSVARIDEITHGRLHFKSWCRCELAPNRQAILRSIHGVNLPLLRTSDRNVRSLCGQWAQDEDC